MKNSKKADYRLGVDMGGTKILAAVVDPDGAIVGMGKKKTKAEVGPDGVIKRILDTASEALGAAKLSMKNISGVGVGAPGPVDYETGVVYSAANLPGWNDVPLGACLKKEWGVPVRIENDANLGALGEFTHGAGRGCRHMLGIWVGTGIGGGVIIDGKLHRGARYGAGEIGHMVALPHGPLCGCGRQGCVEALASRTAIERFVRLGLAEGKSPLVADLLAAENDRFTSSIIAQAVAANDALMLEIISQAQFYLGLMTANLVNVLDPEVVVFGGGVVEALGDAFLQPIRDTAVSYYLQQRNTDQVHIVPATLGDNAGVLGGAALASAPAVRKD
ncbi:MAG: ROK family protein [Caldilineales bacterium]